MFDLSRFWPALFYAALAGLAITVLCWLWTTIQAWRHFSRQPGFGMSTSEFLRASVQQFFHRPGYLNLFLLATALCGFIAAIVLVV